MSGKEYSFGDQVAITLLAGEDFSIVGNSTLNRLAGYTTAESGVSITGTATSDIAIKGLTLADASGSIEQAFLVTTANDCLIQNIKMDGINSGIEVNGANSNKINGCKIKNGSGLAIQASNNSNTQITKNVIEAMNTGIKVSAVSTDAEMIDASNNQIKNTGDTAIFIRAFNARTLSEVKANGNILKDIGKAGIKVSIPAGNDSALIENVTISNNIVRGFGLVVSSPAISSFRDNSDDLNVIQNVSCFGNVVDGRNTAGAVSTQAGDAYGYRFSFVDTVNFDSQSKFTPKEGLFVDHCSDGSFKGVINQAFQDAAASGDAGASFLSNDQSIAGYFGLSIDLVVTNTQASKSGLMLNTTQDCVISGKYSNNGNYGIEESSNGTSTTKSGNNLIDGAVLKGNTTAPILYASNNLLGMQEMNCYDDSGSRHQGDTTRRNALGFAFSKSSKGFVYWNTTDTQLQVHAGSNAWNDTEGTVV